MANDTDIDTRGTVQTGRSADVAALISADIAAQGLGPGERVGAERELADRYQVGRWVIRKALESLEEQRRITRNHGRNGGVFVAHPKVIRDLDEPRGLPSYLAAQGMEAGATVVGTQTIPAEGEAAEALEISDGTWVYQINRIRFADGLPLSVEEGTFRADLFPGLLDQSLVGSLYDIFQSQYGIQLGESTETITAVAADRRLAAALQVELGSPLLAVARCTETEDGVRFEFSRDWYRSDQIEITAHASKRHTRLRARKR